MSADGVKHYGHDEGAWFWGCDACNPVVSIKVGEMDLSDLKADFVGDRVEPVTRADWYCPRCTKTMTSWHATPLPWCALCGQADEPLVRAAPPAVKGHVPEENLPRYRRLVAVADSFRSLGGRVSGYGEYGDANLCWELEKKYRDKAQELRADIPRGDSND